MPPKSLEGSFIITVCYYIAALGIGLVLPLIDLLSEGVASWCRRPCWGWRKTAGVEDEFQQMDYTNDIPIHNMIDHVYISWNTSQHGLISEN